MTTEHEYRWTGDYPAIIDGHTTPEGSGVLAEPGKHFKTVKVIDLTQVPLAVPVKAKKAAPKKTHPIVESTTTAHQSDGEERADPSTDEETPPQ